MAIHIEEQRELQGGFRKTIDAASMDMVLDNLQKSQYQYPVKSTVRELVSNAVDSTKEKFNAQLILRGEAKEEDFYIRRDDPMYKDSNFDPTYFDPAWLSSETQVRIIYEEGSGLEKDRVRIIDQGVGLGGKRLEGYFKLAWSSKRNSKTALGKFGIGAKAALSTQIPYYTVINRYNGREMHFNVYSHKVDSTLPPLDLKTGKKREYITMYAGTPEETTAYYDETTLPNGLEVIVGPVMKHKKQEYLDAVKSQLLYFDNVKLTLKHSNGYEEEIPFKANVLFENDYLIVSDNRQFSKPHLVLNGVNYGYVDFQELELEAKLGNVGIKVAPEDVEVNPSRESVIWNEFTKQTVLTRFKQAAATATSIIEERLKVPDFFQWLRAWSSTKSGLTSMNMDTNDTIAKLSGIVDLSGMEPSFVLDKSIRISYQTFKGLRMELVRKWEEFKGGKKLRTLKRDELHILDSLSNNVPIFITDEKPSIRTQRYLATMYSQGFYLIRYPKDLSLVHGDEAGVEGWISDFSLKDAVEKLSELKKYEKMSKPQIEDMLVEQREKVVGYMKASSLSTTLESVTVPEEFVWVEEEGKDTPQTDVEIETIPPTAAELRKLEQRVVAMTPRGLQSVPRHDYYVFDKTALGGSRPFDRSKGDKTRLYEWQKVEPKLAEIQAWTGEDIYYGTNADEQMIHLAAALTTKGFNRDDFYKYAHSGSDYQELRDNWGMANTINSNTYGYVANYGPGVDVTLLKVAQDQVKHYSAYKHISEFFARYKDEEIGMSKPLIQWHTARILDQHLSKLAFLENYSIFDADKAAKYQKLKQYHQSYYKNIKDLVDDGAYFAMDGEAYKDLVEFQTNVMQLQLFIREQPDNIEAITQLATDLVGVPAKAAAGIDLEIWDLLQELLEYSQPVRVIFNEMPALTGKTDDDDKVSTTPVGAELEAEVRSYIGFKGL